jgi:hypothetical protein
MSPNEQGVVTVTTTEKQEPYALNGGMVTIGDAIEKFFGDSDIFDHNSVSLNGRAINDTDLERELRANDVILVLSANLASGGVKGA